MATFATAPVSSISPSSKQPRDIMHRRRVRQLATCVPTPYGTIPKRRQRRQKPGSPSSASKSSASGSEPKKPNSPPSPVHMNPFLDSSPSFFEVLLHRVLSSMTGKNAKEDVVVGFMPPPSATDAVTLQLDITSDPALSDADTCSCLDDSSSSSCSSSSSESSSFSSALAISNSTCSSSTPPSSNVSSSATATSNITTPVSSVSSASSSVPICSSSAAANTPTRSALSDLLCDHYVQSTTQQNTTSSSCDEPLPDVPLETFRIFEAPSPDDDERWFMWQSPDNWTPVHPKEEAKPATVIIEPKQQKKEEMAPRRRDRRVNGSHLRMIVAEANMMRAQKIVGPLRPRGYLPKRSDAFVPRRPSRLRATINNF
ncbi:hypothetical protein BCR43DRAFT_77851 [Syncephalastrum racemosum]|uniref:Uncharacterized protein n=1 Tax=Syncephalastrum racemosum TaxID=13706 RepID=A0A1X2H2L3_SYNRA|nr:hypothetical protein BCR43DRAFT_77851 [Syncephalastrum racemosum]